MISFALMAFLSAQNGLPYIRFIDSKDDPKITYILVDNTCKVAVDKAELKKDPDVIVDKVWKECKMYRYLR